MTWPTTEFSITDDRTGLEQIVTVGLPIRHRSLEAAPLLLVLDGPWMFGTVLDATRLMSMSGEAPEAIVIGLSFTDRSMGEYLRQRARWLTPTPWVPPVITGVKDVEPAECGRGADLAAFIRLQLLPVVESEHCGGLAVSQRWLIGHSFSALFGLQTLLTDHTMFDRWLLASPSIWWDDCAILKVEAEHGEANDDLPTKVFFSYGEHEDKLFVGDAPADPSDSGSPALDAGQAEPVFDFRMGRNVEDLVSTLRARNHPNLELSHTVTAGDHHASTIGAAVSKGLRALL